MNNILTRIIQRKEIWNRFLCKGLFWNVYEAFGLYPNKSRDLNSYTSLLLGTPEEEVIVKYSNYPLVMEKYYILKDLIEKVGYIY